MSYIHRSIEQLVTEASAEYGALFATGSRQVGKTTTLMWLAARENVPRAHVSLDAPTDRALACEDPSLFLQLHRPPILIDEVQYAPGLFPLIKAAIDAGAPPGSFWLTGSQPFRLMELAGESLAGRVAVLPLTSLSQQEIATTGVSGPLPFDLDTLAERVARSQPADVLGLYRRMWRGAMPAVVAGQRSNIPLFYESYLQTYLERDVRDLSGAVESLPFAAFMRAVAARCSQLLNRQAIARDTGLRSETVRDWLGILERSGVIFYLHPCANNQLKRTVKAPKLYFHDTGLVAHLTGWSSEQTMASGAMAGAFLENYVVSEIRKGFAVTGADVPLYYYRDHDAKEIDLVLERDGELHPVAVKRSASPNRAMSSAFGVLDRSPLPRGAGMIVCMVDGLGGVGDNVLTVPAWAV